MLHFETPLPPPGLFDLFGRPKGRRVRSPFAARPTTRPERAHPERFYLHVRSVAADGFAHLFQFGLVNDRGDVAVNVFVRGRSPVNGCDQAGDGAEPPPVPAIWWDQLAEAMEPCRDAWIIAFGRTLHGSFLPASVRDATASLDCARARFVKFAKRRGLAAAPGDILDVNDARRLIGLPPVRTADAASRAQGLRELWRWMDLAERA